MNFDDDMVSVVIPTFNSEKYIYRALESVLSQTYLNFEIIVVDNNSSDKTKDIVMSFSDNRINLLNTVNNGVIAYSRNIGIKASKGKWVAFLDSDDWWLPDKLKYSVRVLKSGAKIVYHNMYIAQKERNIYLKKMKIRQVNRPVIVDLLINGNMLPNSSVVVCRKTLNEIDLLNEDREFITYEDYDAWIRIAEVTDSFVFISKCLGYYWSGADNLTKTQRSLFVKNVNPNYLKYVGDNYIQFNALIAYMDIKKLYIEKNPISFNLIVKSLKVSSYSLKLKTIYIWIIYLARKIK
jgi:glycosyltransferase involved in cell wall biosynthesis